MAGTFVGGLIGGAVAYVAGDAIGRGLIGPQVADFLFDGKPVDTLFYGIDEEGMKNIKAYSNYNVFWINNFFIWIH